MKFTSLIVLLALASCVLMGAGPGPVVPEKMKKYFHKKMCYCIKAGEGICHKLKCCEIYKYVPYKVFVKFCKYGKCEFVSQSSKPKYPPEKHAGVAL